MREEREIVVDLYHDYRWEEDEGGERFRVPNSPMRNAVEVANKLIEGWHILSKYGYEIQGFKQGIESVSVYGRRDPNDWRRLHDKWVPMLVEALKFYANPPEIRIATLNHASKPKMWDGEKARNALAQLPEHLRGEDE